ncbi:MAG: CHASE domain-containing protein [Tepidisphaeraceae bacterium]
MSTASNSSPRARRRRRRVLVPYAVLAVSLLATAGVALYVGAEASENDRAHFENLAERMQGSIVRRIEGYITLLRGTSGLFAASEHVSAAEFHAYVWRLALREEYPGVQGVGASLRIPGEHRDATVASIRNQPGMEQFDITPADPRPEYHAILFLEPLDERNGRAIGYDMFTEPTRRAAMERARDSAEPALSGKVTLIQEDGNSAPQNGFLIYLPIYRTAAIPTGVDERRDQLTGFVYSPFRTGDLFEGIFHGRTPAGIAFEIYDGTDVTPDALLYSSDDASPENDSHADARFRKREPMQVAGHPWTLVVHTTPAFESSSSRGLTLVVIALGAIVSIVLFALSFGQSTAQLRAERAADELRESEQALRASVTERNRGIEALKAARDAANAARAEAEDASRLKDEFLATVSHELRTPLNAMLGWAQILRKGSLDPEEFAQGIATIERNAKAQAQLVEDLLDVSRIVSGKLRLDVQTVELIPVIENAIEASRPAADAKGVSLHRVLDPHAGPVSGDPDRLQQVVWNLLSNAVKFTPRGGSVQVRCNHRTATRKSSSATAAAGSAGSFCPTSSIASARRTRRSRGSSAGWGWGWASSATSSSCTAGPDARAQAGRADGTPRRHRQSGRAKTGRRVTRYRCRADDIPAAGSGSSLAAFCVADDPRVVRGSNRAAALRL